MEEKKRICRDSRMNNYGVFHGFFGSDDGPIALIERYDGRVEEWPAKTVIFIENEAKNDG
jgi:hypothetical protein